MTKLRPPVSIEQALDRIAGLLTWDEMGKIVGRSGRLVRAWAEADSPRYPTAPMMVKLDAAYRHAGGEGAPLTEAMGHLVEAECCAQFPTADLLGRLAVACIKEGGEANAALVLASRPGATDLDRIAAAKEVTEAIAELTHTLPLLTKGAGPIGNGGEVHPGVEP